MRAEVDVLRTSVICWIFRNVDGSLIVGDEKWSREFDVEFFEEVKSCNCFS